MSDVTFGDLIMIQHGQREGQLQLRVILLNVFQSVIFMTVPWRATGILQKKRSMVKTKNEFRRDHLSRDEQIFLFQSPSWF